MKPKSKFSMSLDAVTSILEVGRTATIEQEMERLMRFALSCGDPVELKNRGFREVFVSNFAHGRDTLARDTEALSCDAEMIGSDFSKAFGYFQDEPEMAQLSANKRWKDVVKARMKQEDGTTKARA